MNEDQSNQLCLQLPTEQLLLYVHQKLDSSKHNAVQNISIALIAHHVNHLYVLSCSSIHSNWLSDHSQIIKLSCFQLNRSSVLSLLSLYRSCLIQSEWAFIARNALRCYWCERTVSVGNSFRQQLTLKSWGCGLVGELVSVCVWGGGGFPSAG